MLEGGFTAPKELRFDLTGLCLYFPSRTLVSAKRSEEYLARMASILARSTEESIRTPMQLQKKLAKHCTWSGKASKVTRVGAPVCATMSRLGVDSHGRRSTRQSCPVTAYRTPDGQNINRSTNRSYLLECGVEALHMIGARVDDTGVDGAVVDPPQQP
jgi:hypothetical protein